MKRDEFLRALQEVLEIEDEVLSEDMNLKDMESFEFDSMTVMALVAFVHEKFNLKFSAVKINSITTVKSLMELIGLDHFE
jgi:acyl carrier protein